MGGKHRPAAPRDRALGAELRAIREQLGMSLADVARKIHWNVSTLSRLERGNRRVSPEAVMGLSMVYDLPTPQRADLVARAKEPPSLGWWNHPPAGLPGELATLASYEHEAATLTDWSPGIVPGLLQTTRYASTVLATLGVPDTNLRSHLQAHLKRQELLDRRQVDYTAFIGTAALHNRFTTEIDHLAQLRHLIRMADREGIEIRLVETGTPFTFGGWYLMDFARATPIALVEHLGSSTFLFDEETRPYLTARRALADLALSTRATQDRLAELVEQPPRSTGGGD